MTLPAWYAAFATAAIVLVLAGGAKLVKPHDTARALRRAGLPASPVAVRLGSGAEVLIGLTALLTADRIAATLLTASYLAFAGFVTMALVRHLPLSTCGCLGEPDTPPTLAHVVLDLALAAAASVSIVHPAHGAWGEMTGHPAEAVVLLALIATAVHLVVTALSALPRAVAPGGSR